MLTLPQAALLGLLQGLTELFPVSSLGHSVLLPMLSHWYIDQGSDQFLSFLVATHLATALVLLFFFRKDWLRIFAGMWRSLSEREIRSDNPYGKLGWLLVIGTIPAGICGLLFESAFKEAFAAGALVALMLVGNGVVLYVAERMRRRMLAPTGGDERLAKLSWNEASYIGLMQCLALVPGFSRSGLTMTAGLWNGLSHEDAARFSFLLATPIIGAAAVLKLPDVFVGGDFAATSVGALFAAGAAWFSVSFLVRYFRTKTLKPFAYYCVAAGAIALLLLR